jgi:hypothetical protein
MAFGYMVYAPRDMATDLSNVNWQVGSIGEWVAGVGAIFLGVVFIWLIRRDRRLQQRTRAQRFDIILHEPEATEAHGWVIDHWSAEVGARQDDLRFYDVQVTLNIPAVGSSTSEPIQTLTAARRQVDFLDGKSIYHEKTWHQSAEATATFRDVDEVWWSVVNDGGKLKRLGKGKVRPAGVRATWVR